MVNRAAFLDRDGTINCKPAEGEYITRWEELRFLPGVAEAIALLNRAGFRVVVVTNQRCVAKGMLKIDELDYLHDRMRRSLADAGATIDEIRVCPHEMEPPCGCRKPQPGMLVDAARRNNIQLSSSWMIGDSDSDVEAGKNAGCNTARLLSANETANHGSCITAFSLLDAVHQILSQDAAHLRQSSKA